MTLHRIAQDCGNGRLKCHLKQWFYNKVGLLMSCFLVKAPAN